jgi:2-keto-3-deoxy-L-rhamnonate aldolase RhmA
MRALWRGPEPALGTFIFMRDAASTEIALEAGHDFVIVDMEHTTLGLGDVLDHQRAADAHLAPMLVRMPGFDPALLGQLLDLGVAGAVLPHYGLDLDAAERFVQAMRYPPQGNRPACSGARAAGHGLHSFAEHAQAANRSLVAIGLLEDVAAIDGIDELLRIAKVDAVMPGPGDLSTSMGLAGQPTHPAVMDAVARIATACARAGTPLGFYLNSTHERDHWDRYRPAFYVHLLDTKILAQAQVAVVRSLARPATGARG